MNAPLKRPLVKVYKEIDMLRRARGILMSIDTQDGEQRIWQDANRALGQLIEQRTREASALTRATKEAGR